jgi:hypothetical protein
MSVVAAGEVPAGPARLRVGTLAEGAAVTIDEVALRRPGEDRWTFVIRSGRRPLGGGEAAPETR